MGARFRFRVLARLAVAAIAAACALPIAGCAGAEEQQNVNESDAASSGGGVVVSLLVARAEAAAVDDGGKLLRDGSWARGNASGYDLDDNEGWDETSSGIPLDHETFTVAVPLADGDLVGKDVQIVYDGKMLTAQVTDVGALGDYERVLDLSPAIWQAFGAETYDIWGVRPVVYRIL